MRVLVLNVKEYNHVPEYSFKGGCLVPKIKLSTSKDKPIDNKTHV